MVSTGNPHASSTHPAIAGRESEGAARRAVHIVRTGSANLASVAAAIERIGATPVPTSDPADVLLADRLVLPGVGSFGAAMAELTQRGLVSALRERLSIGRSTLGICLGLQLLARTSEESPGVGGLSLFDAAITRLPIGPGLRVPQMGWNLTEPRHTCRTLTGGFAYFANSYALPEIPRGWRGSTFAHGELNPVAALEQGDGDRLIVATQFHPELSGRWGLDLIRRWVIGRPSVESLSSELMHDDSNTSEASRIPTSPYQLMGDERCSRLA